MDSVNQGKSKKKKRHGRLSHMERKRIRVAQSTKGSQKRRKAWEAFAFGEKENSREEASATKGSQVLAVT